MGRHARHETLPVVMGALAALLVAAVVGGVIAVVFYGTGGGDRVGSPGTTPEGSQSAPAPSTPDDEVGTTPTESPAGSAPVSPAESSPPGSPPASSPSSPGDGATGGTGGGAGGGTGGTGGTGGGAGGSGGGSGGGAGGAATAMPMPPTVAFRLVGTSWVEVRGPNGEVLTTGICRKGDHAEFRQSRVQVVVGNAAAVRLTANGMPVELGGPGQVRVLTVTRGGAGD